MVWLLMRNQIYEKLNLQNVLVHEVGYSNNTDCTYKYKSYYNLKQKGNYMIYSDRVKSIVKLLLLKDVILRIFKVDLFIILEPVEMPHTHTSHFQN